jgi:DNA-binding HxlR family transcriptional regulator
MTKSRRAKKFNCPVERTIDVIGGKWKSVILWNLRSEPRRFTELRKLIPNVTVRMLTNQLRELEQDGVISRTVFAEVPPKVEYALTDLGKSLRPILDALSLWGRKNAHKSH